MGHTNYIQLDIYGCQLSLEMQLVHAKDVGSNVVCKMLHENYDVFICSITLLFYC